MRIRKHNLLAIVLLVSCLAAFAQRKALTAAETATFKAAVAATMESLQSLESDFTQTKQLSYLESAVRSTGKLYFKAPNKIRWEYHSPTNYVIIFDDQTMHTADGRRIKTVDLAANRSLKGLSDLLVHTIQGGNILDEDRFDITYYGQQAAYVAVLVPKEKALLKYIRQVELTFDGTTLLLNQVTLIDSAGDRTQLAFTNQLKNTPIPDAKFAAEAAKRG